MKKNLLLTLYHRYNASGVIKALMKEDNENLKDLDKYSNYSVATIDLGLLFSFSFSSFMTHNLIVEKTYPLHALKTVKLMSWCCF